MAINRYRAKTKNKAVRPCNIGRRLASYNPSDQEEPQYLLDYWGYHRPYFGYTNISYPGSGGASTPIFPYPGQPMDAAKYGNLLSIMEAQLGKPYVWGAHPMGSVANPSSFDCAGFVGYCFMRAGLLPTGWYTTYSLWTYLQANGSLVSTSEAAPGDIVLTNDTKGGHNYPAAGNGTNSHALVYVGNNWCIDCSSSAGGVGYHYQLVGSWVTARLTGGGVWRLNTSGVT